MFPSLHIATEWFDPQLMSIIVCASRAWIGSVNKTNLIQTLKLMILIEIQNTDANIPVVIFLVQVVKQQQLSHGLEIQRQDHNQ